MRRLLFSMLILMVFSVSSLAEVVTFDNAQETAKSFFKQKGKPSPKHVWSGFEEMTKSSSIQTPAFYVFNNDQGGFVIIAGDDIVPSVLGYSDNGAFVTENMPENVSCWFRQLQSYIEYGRSIGTPSVKAGSSESKLQGVLVKTPNWKQNEPFNLKCPKYENKQTIAGCVAIAMSEILWSLKYPERGTGTVPAYTTKTNSIYVAAHDLGAYDWTLMPEKLTDGWTDQQKEAVSQLVFDCGTMVKSDYGTDGTGAYDSAVVPALVKYMGVDSAAVLECARWYTSEEWKAKLRESHDQGRAVFYSGDNSDWEGHAFVVDGYDANGAFHINFGWGGTNNGYYQFPDFGKGKQLFTEDHISIFGIKPNEGGSPKLFMAFDKYNESDRGLVSKSIVFTKEVEFTVKAEGIIHNPCETTFKGNIAVARYDSGNHFRELASEAEPFDCLPHYGAVNAEFRCKCSNISKGDKLMVVTSRGGEEWTPIFAQKDDKSFAYELSLLTEIDETVLAKNTSLAYDKAKKLFTLESVSGVKCVVKDAQGAEIPGIAKVDDYVITVDAKSLESGKYTFVISLGDVSVSFGLEI